MTRPVAMPTRAASGSPAGVVTAGQRLGQRQPGADRPLGLVLVRLRPAEVGEHAIAHVLGDVAAPALDHLGAAFLIGADHPAHVLGIEPRRQLGRADQIAEQHRQLPPLGFRRPNFGCCLTWGALFCLRRQSRFRQSGDRFEELAAMSDDGDANVFEIVSSQLGQNLGVNLVLPERRLVALQPQLAQPRRNVHDVHRMQWARV